MGSMKPDGKDFAATCPQCGAPLPEVAGRIRCHYCGSTVMLQGREPPPSMTTAAPPAPATLDLSPYYYVGLSLLLVGFLLFLLSAAIRPRFAGKANEPARTRVATSISATSWEATVLATESWQDTGLRIHIGQAVTITHVSGTWSAWGGPGGVKRQTDGTGFEGEYRNTTPLPDAPVGALIGRVGREPPFFVGNRLEFTADEVGPLAFRINDGWLGDNTGALTIEIDLPK